MIVELKGSDYYHVPLVDLIQLSGGLVIRTFASSEQVIDWVTHHPNVVFKTVRHGALGKKVAPPMENYSLETGDIIVGDGIMSNSYGVRQHRTSLPGGSG